MKNFFKICVSCLIFSCIFTVFANSNIYEFKPIQEEFSKAFYKKNAALAEIDGSNFSLISNIYFDEKAKVRKTCIIAVDELKFKIACGKYQPFLIEAEFDEDYSEEENLAMVIESFIRHKTGLIKPEEIENN